MDTTVSVLIMAVMPSGESNSICMTDTTLSLAIKPLISDVTMRQSPRPAGLISGAIRPAIAARMLSCESSTILRRKSKVCRNQITSVAIRITVNARCRKSRDFSQSSWSTLRGLGRR